MVSAVPRGHGSRVTSLGSRRAPSVAVPERFHDRGWNRARLPPSVSHTGYGRLAAFQSAIPLAVLWPESFRGGCSFGAGRADLSRRDHLDLCCTAETVPHSQMIRGGGLKSTRPAAGVEKDAGQNRGVIRLPARCDQTPRTIDNRLAASPRGEGWRFPGRSRKSRSGCRD